MIKEINQELKVRADKAIANIRLIASRVKRAHVEDAGQKRESVVNALNAFRQYIAAVLTVPSMTDQYNQIWTGKEAMRQLTEAMQTADIIYHMLTREKQRSYKEEYKQVSLLLVDIFDYFINMDTTGGTNAPK